MWRQIKRFKLSFPASIWQGNTVFTVFTALPSDRLAAAAATATTAAAASLRWSIRIKTNGPSHGAAGRPGRPSPWQPVRSSPEVTLGMWVHSVCQPDRTTAAWLSSVNHTRDAAGEGDRKWTRLNAQIRGEEEPLSAPGTEDGFLCPCRGENHLHEFSQQDWRQRTSRSESSFSYTAADHQGATLGLWLHGSFF